MASCLNYRTDLLTSSSAWPYLTNFYCIDQRVQDDWRTPEVDKLKVLDRVQPDPSFMVQVRLVLQCFRQESTSHTHVMIGRELLSTFMV
jgi:hypothetical protein